MHRDRQFSLCAPLFLLADGCRWRCRHPAAAALSTGLAVAHAHPQAEMQRRWSCRPTTARRRAHLARGVYDGRARAPYGLGLLMLLLSAAPRAVCRPLERYQSSSRKQSAYNYGVPLSTRRFTQMRDAWVLEFFNTNGWTYLSLRSRLRKKTLGMRRLSQQLIGARLPNCRPRQRWNVRQFEDFTVLSPPTCPHSTHLACSAYPDSKISRTTARSP